MANTQLAEAARIILFSLEGSEGELGGVGKTELADIHQADHPLVSGEDIPARSGSWGVPVGWLGTPAVQPRTHWGTHLLLIH